MKNFVIINSIDIIMYSCRIIKTTKSLFRISPRFWTSCPSEREVFICDDNHNLRSWLQDNYKNTKLIKHPSSKHIAASYAKYVHNNGSYNFNTIDDYVLTITAAEQIEETSHENPTLQMKSTDEINDNHRLLIWPDGIKLSNLTRVDIDKVGKLLLNSATITADQLNKILTPTVNITSMTGITIILPVCSTSTYKHIKDLYTWFHYSLKMKAPEKEITYFLSNEMKKPNNMPTQVLVLPHDITFSDVRSQKRVEQIVDLISSRLT